MKTISLFSAPPLPNCLALLLNLSLLCFSLFCFTAPYSALALTLSALLSLHFPLNSLFLLISGDLRRSQAAGGTNSKQYWAKGTGFGTGSTSSGWNIEQALVKQKNEEEHITWILQVNFFNPFTRSVK